WTVNGVDTAATMPYHFKVLGTYRQTQYNTPAESTCTGTATPVTVYTSACSASAGSMVTGFVFRLTAVNTRTGSCHSLNYHDVQIEAFCSKEPNSFRRDATIRGTLGSLDNSTVVACSSDTDLYVAGTRVFLRGIGIKTVTDRCPACCADRLHLD